MVLGWTLYASQNSLGLLAGAGVKRSDVHGDSDRHGEYPHGRPHPPGDMAATFYWALGLDPQVHMHDAVSRSYALADGQPIMDFFSEQAADTNLAQNVLAVFSVVHIHSHGTTQTPGKLRTPPQELLPGQPVLQ